MAFYGCSSLTSVVIGGGVKTIGSGAFANCPELTDVTCYAENVPSTQSNAFEDSYIEHATLHVPTASIDVYKTTVPWSGFGKIYGINDPSNINDINIEFENAMIFDMQGNRLDNVRKGVNLIRKKGGKTKKVIVK